MTLIEEMTRKCEKIAFSARKTLLNMNNYSVRNIHWGGSLSCIDILSVLYGAVLEENESVFILSKGHAAPGLYAVLYSVGKLSLKELQTYQQNGSRLTELIEWNPDLGFHSSGGSLGNGLSYAVGVALWAKRKNNKTKVYVIVGDGEINEGIVWEAILSANKYKLDNLYIVVDCNGMQSDGMQSDIMPYYDLNGIFVSLGCEVKSIDGNDCNKLLQSFNSYSESGKPKILIANTVKGKGISFMESNNLWHDKRMTSQEYEIAINEVNNYAFHE